ncbi:CHC2 zinc finger domain-containing protein [Macellibacteroides fermentans]|uniref:DNA primase n=1 Tax=Macellibacteroides fermentans TaxID=879969 RepID=A0A8E1ZWR8_9PORP|nr:CHC2 zinc finger domain-containing protein [Macellibacteroides fermentans]NYI48927.1 DNA primase [Macellibacteroides fermentans]
MGNSKEEIAKLKEALNIEDVIGTYVELEYKLGGKCLGLCPFHDDSTPSMHVHTGKQIFKCFACNEGGDVIAFISKIKSCTFAEAVNLLRQEWCNGSTPPPQHIERRAKAKAQKPAATPAQLAAMEAENVKFMRSMYGFHPPLATLGDLMKAGYTGSIVNTGLVNDTRLLGNAELVNDTRLMGNAGLVKGTRLMGNAGLLNDTGLLNNPELEDNTGGNGNGLNRHYKPEYYSWMEGGKYHPDCDGITQTYVDYEVSMAKSTVPSAFKAMRGRIVFPIRDENNRLVAFAGRTTQTITDENRSYTPKYVNSQTSDLYNKSRTLYGLHLAGEAIRTETFAFLTEGYKDTLAMVAAGFKNTVAQCGAAFTDDHAELLKRYTKRVAVLMDADDRGREIAAAAIAVLHRHGMQTSELLLPPGEDPDSLFRRIGKHAFRTIVAESQLTGHLQALKESTGMELASFASSTLGSSSTLSNRNGDPSGLQGTAGTGNQEVIQMNGEATNIEGHYLEADSLDIKGTERQSGNSSDAVLQSDRPRLMAREQELQHQMRKLGSKRFLFGQGPERMQINTELMKLRSQLSEVSKQLNRPVVWYK